MSQPESDRLLKIYDVGETVVIHSLVKAANLNNRQGRLMAFNDNTKRWSVHLLESNEKLKAIKPGNLKPATECTSTFELMKANRAPITATPTMQMKMKMHEGEKEDDEVEKGDDDEYAKAKQRVCAVYAEQVTCASCHSNVVPPGHDFLKSVYKN